jgi:hypothetical protein
MSNLKETDNLWEKVHICIWKFGKMTVYLQGETNSGKIRYTEMKHDPNVDRKAKNP